MAGHFWGKTKRKDIDHVYDEHLSFSYPATKIRRLDGELMPIMEGDESEAAVAMEFDQQLSTAQAMKHESVDGLGYAVPALGTSEERALVVYKPMDTSLSFVPGNVNVGFKVNCEFIDGIRNYGSKIGDQSIARMDEKTAVSDNSLALVPWVPSQTFASTIGYDKYMGSSEAPMESDEPEGASMEVDELDGQVVTGGLDSEGTQQWQPHCMTPQVLPTASAAIMWSL